MEILPKIRGGFRYPSAKSTRSRTRSRTRSNNKKKNGKKGYKGGKSKRRGIKKSRKNKK